MFYLGIDQHKRFSQVAVLDESGKRVHQARWSHDAPERIRADVRRFRPAVAALEATRNWDWLFELLEEEVEHVVLSHPARTRLIAEAKIKTDQVDARVLAQLLRAGFLPTAYAPPREVRDGRELHRYRITLVRHQTQIKNRIHALLDRQGIQAPDGDLFGRRGREWLAQLAVREPYRLELDSLLHRLDEAVAQRRTLERELRRRLRADPRSPWLLSVPGIGEMTAYLILYEVGDIHRFASAKRFAAYCALTPSTRQSADHCYHGHVGRAGNLYLKWALVESAHIARRYDPALAALHDRLRLRGGYNKATVAVARHLAIAVYQVLVREQPYRFRNRTDNQPGKPEGDCWSATR